MSIHDDIARLCRKGELVHVLPIEQWRSVERDVFVSKEVWEFLQGNDPDPKFQAVGLRAYRRIERFICGASVVFGMDPLNKRSTSLIARNNDVRLGVVDVRVNDPQPAVRIFGCFAEKDVLVLLLWRSRKLLQDKGFASSVKRTHSQWTALFPHHSPLVSESPHDYISGILDIG